MNNHPQLSTTSLLHAVVVLLLCGGPGVAVAMDSGANAGPAAPTSGDIATVVDSSAVSQFGDDANAGSVGSSPALNSSQGTDQADVMDSSSAVFVLSSGGTGTSFGSSVLATGGDEAAAPSGSAPATVAVMPGAAPAATPGLSTAGMGSTPAGFGANPSDFGTSAAGHGSTPSGFGVSPDTLNGAAAGHGTSAQGFGSSPQGFGGTPSNAGGGKYTDTSDIYGN